MFDESFWVAVAFVLFFAVFGRRLWVFLTDRLDRRSQAVREEIEEAVKLREEAQALLASYQRRQRDAAGEAEALIAAAREEAARIAADSEARAAEQLARRERLAREEIARLEARAAVEVRAAAVDSVIAAAGRAIAAELDAAGDRALVDRAAAELESRLG